MLVLGGRPGDRPAPEAQLSLMSRRDFLARLAAAGSGSCLLARARAVPANDGGDIVSRRGQPETSLESCRRSTARRSRLGTPIPMNARGRQTGRGHRPTPTGASFFAVAPGDYQIRRRARWPWSRTFPAPDPHFGGSGENDRRARARAPATTTRISSRASATASSSSSLTGRRTENVS